MKIKILFVIALLLMGLGAYYASLQRSELKHDNELKLSGTIEMITTELSFRLPGRVEKRIVSEGETIMQGALVARLETKELQQQLQLRQAEALVQQAQVTELLAGSRPEEIAQAAAALEQAKAQAELARLQLARQYKLHQETVIPTRDYEVATSDDAVAKAKVNELNERLELLKKGSRIETINQARARHREAMEAVFLAKTQLGYAELTSPLSGVVLTEHVESGEYVSAGTPVVTVGDVEQVFLRAYINETDLGKVKLGQKVTIHNDTFPDKAYEGTLSFISSEAEFTPKNIQTAKERVRLVYRIKVDIPNPKQELKAGMPVDAIIRV